MTSSSASTTRDIPVTISGYATDPRRAGYQTLYNYENFYYRALVGNDAWGFYEVLRGFCHHGQTMCYPSINLLMAIMGIKERRLLTGRNITVNGICRTYPGLIDILQQHGVLITQVEGEGPTMRYVFHVDLHPPLLTPAQVAKLPKLLQKKHAELLARCEEAAQELKANQRPSKMSAPEPGGSGNLPEGSGNLPRGSGNLPDKQHNNITHRTKHSAREEKDNNNNSDAQPPTNVVVALVNQGISEKVANRLAGHYSKARIEEKITYLTFLQTEAPDKVQNPRGWLRRAIEEDYGPPDGFVTVAERERRAAEEAQRASATEAQHQAFVVERQAQQEVQRRHLQERFGTTAEDETLWAEVLAHFKHSRPDLHDVYARAQMLHCTEEAVQLGFEQEAFLRQLDHPGTMTALKRQLKLITKRPLEVERVLLPVEPMGYTKGDGADSPTA